MFLVAKGDILLEYFLFLPSSLKIANRNQLPVRDSYESPADMANRIVRDLLKREFSPVRRSFFFFFLRFSVYMQPSGLWQTLSFFVFTT